MDEKTKNQIRQIIQEELSDFLGMDKFIFEKHIQVFNGKNIQIGKSVGTKIGTETNQKLGFFGTTPVDKPETVADPSGSGDAGVDTPARTAINDLIDRLQELGLIK